MTSYGTVAWWVTARLDEAQTWAAASWLSPLPGWRFATSSWSTVPCAVGAISARVTGSRSG